MNLIAIVSNMRLPDILDIFFISVVSYHLLLWFWGTKAFKALVGLLLLSGVFTIAESWGLFLTTWVFQIMWQVFVILLIILFQKEIREMLERFNPLKTFGLKMESETEAWVAPFVKWAFDTAEKRIGAVIIFERTDLIYDLITKGISLESSPEPGILDTIFQKKSPMHDGAVLISQGRIQKTACYLPLTTEENLPQYYGTRHRAALGLTEQCDAWVLIISEERGTVSLARNNQIETIDDPKKLTDLVREAILPGMETHIPYRKKMLSLITRRMNIKAYVFTAVCIVWLLFAGQQNVEIKLNVNLDMKNVPESLRVSEPQDQVLSITFQGLRKDVSLLNAGNVQSSIDLSSEKAGETFYTVTTGNLSLPNDRIHIVQINPSRIRIVLENKP